jgi:hypothetical protein
VQVRQLIHTVRTGQIHDPSRALAVVSRSLDEGLTESGGIGVGEVERESAWLVGASWPMNNFDVHGGGIEGRRSVESGTVTGDGVGIEHESISEMLLERHEVINRAGDGSGCSDVESFPPLGISVWRDPFGGSLTSLTMQNQMVVESPNQLAALATFANREGIDPSQEGGRREGIRCR